MMTPRTAKPMKSNVKWRFLDTRRQRCHRRPWCLQRCLPPVLCTCELRPCDHLTACRVQYGWLRRLRLTSRPAEIFTPMPMGADISKPAFWAVKSTFLHVCSYSGLSTKRMIAMSVADCQLQQFDHQLRSLTALFGLARTATASNSSTVKHDYKNMGHKNNRHIFLH